MKDKPQFLQSPDHAHHLNVLWDTIRMYLIDNRHHNLPHIHAKYANLKLPSAFADGEILAGELPRK